MVKSKNSKSVFLLNKLFLNKRGQAAPPGRIRRAAGLAWRNKNPVNAVRNARDSAQERKGGMLFIILTAILYIFDIFLRYNGININKFLNNFAFTSIDSYVGWFFNSIVITLLIAYWILYRPRTSEFISAVLVIEAISLILFLGGMGTMLVHLAFVCIFYYFYIRPSRDASDQSKASANYIFLVLLLFDFFGYGLLAEFIKNPVVSNRLIIPIWFYFALIYTHEEERGGLVDLLIIIVILINVFYFMGGINGLRSMADTLTNAEKQEGVNFLRTGWKNVKDTWNKAWTGFKSDLESQLIYASGGYYKGKVEKNKIGPLGVFIDKLQTSQPRYYEGEKVIIWGTVKALSLGDGVNIKINCHKKDEEKYATEVKPDVPFTIYSREIRDFECVFDPMKTPWFADLGIHTITVDAEFNFGTLAYLKAYFMDLERKRGMIREGLDPFKEFGIKDTDPVAVYTDGPVIIGMETTSPLIEVGEGIITQPRIGITLENREGWEGKIRSLSELILLTPPGVVISQPKSDCGDVKFKEYNLKDCGEEAFCCYDDKKYDGKGSCEKFVFKPCVDVCVAGKMGNKNYKGNEQEVREECKKKKECERDYKNCKEDCNLLSKGEGEKIYKGYALDTTELNIKDRFKDIDRYRSFSCRLTVDQDVLGTTPLTLKNFRVKVRYNYTLSRDIDIQVQSEPGTAVKVSETIDITEDIDLNKPIPAKIKEIVKKVEVEEKYAMGLAYVESRFRHCCTSDSGTGKKCMGTSEVICPPERTIASDSSVGVMQVNIKKFDTTACAGMVPNDMYNLDKNIECGLNILKGKYRSYREGLTKEYFITTNQNVCKDERFIPKYASYTEWDAALRGYNGWGCGENADINFVKTVNDAMTAMGYS